MKKIFIRGLLAVVPVAITIAIIIWIFDIIEGFFRDIIVDTVGSKYYFTGLGLLIALVLIFFIGVIINNFLIQKLYGWFEKLLHKMPLVKTIYRPVVDLMSFFKGNPNAANDTVVMVQYGDTKMMGLVTREHFDDLPQGMGKEGEVAVYIPMSYQIGGITVIVPKSKVKKIDLTIEQGMRMAATAIMPGKQDPTKDSALNLDDQKEQNPPSDGNEQK